MKIIQQTFIYLLMPLFVVVIGCSYENQPLISFDGKRYTVADFKENYQFTSSEDSIARMNKVDDFINHTIAVQEARARGYDKDPVVLSAYETHYKDVMTQGYYEALVVDRIKITDAEVRKIYEQIIDRYHLAQIVVSEESLARYIEGELKRGVVFDSLLKFSLDTLTEKGDIGEFAAISLPPEILSPLQKIKDGQTTSAIKFGDYFYILKLVEHKKSETPDFATVKENIKNSLKREKVSQESEKFVQKLIADAKIEYNQAGLDALTKPDSLLTEADLNTWVVKKYDTSYVYVRTLRNSVYLQYRQSFMDPQRLIERVLVQDLIYDKAVKGHYDTKPNIKKKLENAMETLMFQKFNSDEIVDKVSVDSLEIVNYFNGHPEEYKDKKLDDVKSIITARIRDEKIADLRKKVFEDLRMKYLPKVNQVVLAKLLVEGKKTEKTREEK